MRLVCLVCLRTKPWLACIARKHLQFVRLHVQCEPDDQISYVRTSYVPGGNLEDMRAAVAQPHARIRRADHLAARVEIPVRVIGKGAGKEVSSVGGDHQVVGNSARIAAVAFGDGVE